MKFQGQVGDKAKVSGSEQSVFIINDVELGSSKEAEVAQFSSLLAGHHLLPEE